MAFKFWSWVFVQKASGGVWRSRRMEELICVAPKTAMLVNTAGLMSDWNIYLYEFIQDSFVLICQHRVTFSKVWSGENYIYSTRDFNLFFILWSHKALPLFLLSPCWSCLRTRGILIFKKQRQFWRPGCFYMSPCKAVMSTRRWRAAPPSLQNRRTVTPRRWGASPPSLQRAREFAKATGGLWHPALVRCLFRLRALDKFFHQALRMSCLLLVQPECLLLLKAFPDDPSSAPELCFLRDADEVMENLRVLVPRQHLSDTLMPPTFTPNSFHPSS